MKPNNVSSTNTGFEFFERCAIMVLKSAQRMTKQLSQRTVVDYESQQLLSIKAASGDILTYD